MSSFFYSVYKSQAGQLGVKVWVRTDSVTGYIYNINTYTGKDPSHPIHPLGVSYDDVTTLMKDVENKGYTVYIDNYCTSPILY